MILNLSNLTFEGQNNIKKLFELRIWHTFGPVLSALCSFDRAFGQVESRLSQTISKKVKECHKKESNSRRKNVSLALNYYTNCTRKNFHFYVNQKRSYEKILETDRNNKFPPKLIFDLLSCFELRSTVFIYFS